MNLFSVQALSKEKLWKIDLDAFLTKLDEVEEQERLDDAGRSIIYMNVVVIVLKGRVVV